MLITCSCLTFIDPCTTEAVETALWAGWISSHECFCHDKPWQRKGLGFRISAILCCFARIVFCFCVPFMMLVVCSRERTICPVTACCCVRSVALMRYMSRLFTALVVWYDTFVNPLKHELNPICYLLALLAHHFLHVSRIRVKSLPLRLLMSYIYIYIYIYIWSAYSWCF